jgi:tRNA-(MS[2]IO[6]A)-hydroxylase MiaE-like protein
MTSSTPSPEASTPSLASVADEVTVLGLVAALELATFERLAADAAQAPTLEDKVQLARASAAAMTRQGRLFARLTALGADPLAAVTPFAGVLDDFDARTPPSTWWERLLKAVVGYGVADDFCRHLARGLDEQTRSVVLSVLDDVAYADIAASELVAAGSTDAVLVSRLALWGRRLVGEALGVVQTLLATHPELLRLATLELVDASGDGDRSPKLFGQLTAEHTRRMARLGLTA